MGKIMTGKVGRDEGIYVGRPSPLGNPFTVEEHGREVAIIFYRTWLSEEVAKPLSPAQRAIEQLISRVRGGEDLTLLCHCDTLQHCHAEVVRDFVLAGVRVLER